MATTPAKVRNLEDAFSSLNGSVLRTVTGRAGLVRRGLSVVRDWKIYADFLSPAYQQNNIARLQHLDSLGLDLRHKIVLEIGAAIGDHTLFYMYRNCSVLAVEGRSKLADRLSKRLGIEVRVLDVDREPERLDAFGHFDLVHCYGLLYHLSDPGRFLSVIARVGSCLLLETCVSFGNGSINLCQEDKSVASQALHGKGCRPTRAWVFEELKRHYKWVYATRTQPRHPEFPLDWTSPDQSGPQLQRAVFVASHRPIDNSNLLAELPEKQSWT